MTPMLFGSNIRIIHTPHHAASIKFVIDQLETPQQRKQREDTSASSRVAKNIHATPQRIQTPGKRES